MITPDDFERWIAAPGTDTFEEFIERERTAEAKADRDGGYLLNAGRRSTFVEVGDVLKSTYQHYHFRRVDGGVELVPDYPQFGEIPL